MRLIRVMRLVLAAALACACVTPPPVDEHVAPDLTAMDAFWSVYATLRSDQDPADSQWAAMFETPAYRYLIEVERREPVFRRLLPAVVKPGGDLDAVLDERPELAPFAEHYRRVVEHEADLRALHAALASGSLVPEARALANDYLPQAAVDDPWWPAVAPVISHPDGTVHEGTIVVDLLLMLDAGDEARPLFIAHEMHHAYVRRHWPPVPPEADGSERLLHALDQLRMEGTADLIDKGMPFDSRVYPSAYREQYRDAYGRSDAILAAVNGLLERIDAEPGSTAAHAEALWTALPLAGHPTGAFMARRILDELGRARLMAALESPVAFARIYQEASAVPGGRPTFSDAALRVIDRLEAAAGGAGTRRTP